MRSLAFLYGTICYLTFLAAFLYLIGFLGDFAVPKSIDTGAPAPLAEGVLVDVALLAVFGLQHSVMARPTFKRLWTRIVPTSIERSTYVLLSNLALALLYWQWRPVEGALWRIEDPVGKAIAWSIFAAGWLLVLVSTLLINHFDLFGMRQVYLDLKGEPYQPLRFKVPGLYRFVRHPLYVGWLLAFWATPAMTLSHLIFSLGTTVYILIAIRLEERNLLQFHGDDYRKYMERVPMLIPRWKKKGP